MPYLSRFQAFGLILLRTLIGWHFLYEGYYKLMLPGWSRTGTPLAPFSAAGYMKGATGPLAPFIRPLADSAAMMGWIDILVPLGLLLVGLSLVLGLVHAARRVGRARLPHAVLSDGHSAQRRARSRIRKARI